MFKCVMQIQLGKYGVLYLQLENKLENRNTQDYAVK